MAEQNSTPTELAEKELLEEGDPWKLASFYARTNRHQLALSYLEYRVAEFENPDNKTLFYMLTALAMEGINDYKAAILYYSKLFSFKCEWEPHMYFRNNNMGFCLNQCKRYKEAEPYCRNAIIINPMRFNAYKNLGVSLEGQGQYQAAAELYMKATTFCPCDARALSHLENLITIHKEKLLNMQYLDIKSNC